MGFSQRLSSIIYLIYTFAVIFLASAADPRQFPFTSFSEKTDQDIFHFGSPYSSIDQGALQLTPDTENGDVSYFNKSGRIMYHKPYRLWSSDDVEEDEVASFNSTFLMNIFRKEEWTAGEGFAFLIASDWSIPQNSHGQWLGLTNATTDGNTTNYMVAIEFDTGKQDFDPDDNHIGLNINSVISNKTVSLDPFDIEISPEVGTNYTVWVQYDGSTKVLEVYMAKRIMTIPAVRPEIPLMRETINLRSYLKQDSYFGFSGSTGSAAKQLNCVLEWDLKVQIFKTKKNKILLKVGVPALVLLVLFGVILGAVYVKKRKRTSLEESLVLVTLKRLPGMPREFKYKELKDATNNFHASMILGQGGFGIVYRGTLPDSNDANGTSTSAEIAVKQFSRDSIKGKDDFMAELTIIHRLRHKNLVRLVGWCYEKGKLLLVYDFMPNGSVDGHLYGAKNQSTLNWERRCKILAGVASALHYLQNEYDQKVVHRDLKASNILLDSEFNARLGDFGLARALEQERNSYAELELAGVAGTLGYVAPECFHTRKATPESDIFSFGAVVLEIVCGRSPGIQIVHEQHQLSLVDWVWMLHREGCIEEAVDERLNSNYVLDEAKKLLLLGLACSHPIASERPQTQAICQIISGTMSVPSVPPFKPVFTWPSMSIAIGTAFSSTDSTVSSILSRNTLSLP
ncbi:probable L-type lectin-domain containing receptor kinase S.5 [Argentina anserina]|uniref:probable L-type lectin-domain containing receptor kinase S.5 n=1 Tax=Argentina anserina TaxID=57926 RepID=UPI0021762BFF|nr:probable L-type lectin-domain containing receptor kinase S.5 [Potentilla anserina]